ncbi:hypothetical protein [Butyrivibrio sp. NC2007]|uniref:hypothetical protein n=1 Tax=Butyrivibrio sp. NC2007 TaxID=1280683 RepID=UPI0003B5C160|nr:hypothetical protein [Butyrivibrio sp. NC2007]
MGKGELQQILWNQQYKIWKKGNLQTKDIFDIHYNARQRSYKVGEVYSGNNLYSMGYALREYSDYHKQIYCATEHFVTAGKTDNVGEFRDNDRKILLVPSDDRRNTLQPLTDKLIITYGPGVIPYTKNIYSDLAMQDVKSYLGKTLLLFPRHSSDDSIVLENRKRFVDYINNIVEQYNYDTVLCCLFYVDITRGAYLEYQKYGWIPVTAGHQANYDFGYCLRTLINLSDHVIMQGYGSSANYALYLKKPVTFYSASRSVNIEGRGVDQDHNAWMKPFEEEMIELFGDYNEEINDRQYSRVSELFGFNDVRSPEELKAILELAAQIENKKCIDESYIRTQLTQKRFSCIERIVSDALNVRNKYCK